MREPLPTRGRPALTQEGVGQTCTSLLILGFCRDPSHNDSDELSLPSKSEQLSVPAVG